MQNDVGRKVEFSNLTDILKCMSERGLKLVTELNYDGHIHYLLKKDSSSQRMQNKDFDSIQANSNDIAAYLLTDRRLFIKKKSGKHIEKHIAIIK